MSQLLPTHTIVDKLRRGDDVNGVTRYLYKTYERPLKGYVRRQGGSVDDANDLIQEVMIAFLHQVQAGRFEQRDNAELRSYLLGIARRKWLKKIESETRRQERQLQFVAGTDGPETPDAIVAEADYRSWAWEQFQQLGESCRQILTAFYRDEQSLDDIAVQYGLGTVGAVKMRKFRCIQKLLKRTDL